MRETLTNEQLRGLFKSNFELAKYAIGLGRYFIKSGHEANLDYVLDQVRRHPSEDYLETLKQIDAEDREESEDNG